MRPVPIVTAIVVGVLLYAFVMQREALLALAGAEPAAGETAAEAPEPADDATPVVALRSEAQTVASGVLLRGRTEAARRVEVRAETTGTVVSDPLRRGAEVEKGDLLCRLDPGSRAAALAEAEARLLEAEANNRAAEQLAERGFTAETTAIGRRALLQSAEAAVEQARIEMQRLEIVAPFEGLLEDDAAELGSLLQAGSACATIIDLDPIKLVGFVTETSVGRLSTGDPVSATLLTGEEVTGSVSFVARSADPDTRTFRVEAEAPNPDGAIRDGITAEIRIGLAGETAHLLPQSALTLDDAGRLGVRTAEGGTARFVPVEVIRDATDGVWIAGLPETAEVIVVGQDFVTDGSPIAVSYREPGP